QSWIEQLPDALQAIERRWSLQLGPPFRNLTINFVAPATLADGRQVVLKAGVATQELHNEVGALRAFDGQGAVRLLDADAERGFMLLERLRPGTPLLNLEDNATVTRT